MPVPMRERKTITDHLAPIEIRPGENSDRFLGEIQAALDEAHRTRRMLRFEASLIPVPEYPIFQGIEGDVPAGEVFSI
ncbi:MAG: hypothetical protein Q7S10_03900 [bacterium]|nr:hypothetical protein [bacterium]